MFPVVYKMEFSSCSVGLVMIAAVLVQVSEARQLPSAGLLDAMPQNCSTMDYCQEKHRDYPQARVDDLLMKRSHLTLGDHYEDFSKRVGPDVDNQNDCKWDLSYDLIYEIVDENENVRVVVQSEKLFKQQLRIEWCLSPGRLNGDGTAHFSSSELETNYIYCEEKKMDYNFLVLSLDGTKLESVRSKHGIPVCCSCRVTSY